MKTFSAHLWVLDVILEHAGEGEEAEPGEECPVLPRVQLPLHVLAPGRGHQHQQQHQEHCHCQIPANTNHNHAH